MPASVTSWKHEPFKQGVPLAYQAFFDVAESASLKAGLIPQAMEDKWFVYYDEPHLFFHRSWTGQPVYRLTLRNVPNGFEVTEALWSKDIADTTKPDFDYQVKLLDFLVSNLLLGQAKPFPVSPGLMDPMHGVFQHHISGTGYPESPTADPKLPTVSKKPWWRIW
jgi:hypothetical protein